MDAAATSLAVRKKAKEYLKNAGTFV